jgi:hypothetical protein
MNTAEHKRTRPRRSALPHGVLAETARRLGVPVTSFWYRVHGAKDADALREIAATIEERERRAREVDDAYRETVGLP